MSVENFENKRKTVVLVIEDDDMLRHLTLSLLGGAGFDPLEAENADDAIAILESRDDVEIIFTDINMPGSMDGLKLAHAVRDRWPPIHIIITSGRAPVGKRQLPPGSRFFMKPYDHEHVVDVFRALSA